MGRVYTVQFNNVAVAAVQDLFELTPADDKPIKLLGVVISEYDAEVNEQLTCTIQRRTGAYTSGSGGGTATPVRLGFSGGIAAGFTCETNNTVRATGGTQEIIHSEGFPSQGGFAFTPIPGCEPQAIQAEALIIGLEVAPGVSTKFNGTAYVEEMP